jgi:DNA-binding NarL/FixJ family response regulator
MRIGKKPVAPKARVFVVDDHPIIRRGLHLLIALEPDLQVCGEADARVPALEQIRKLQPDVAVVDLSLKNSSGLELVKDLRTRFPKVKILVFTMHDEPIYTERVLKAGAHGYVTKQEGAEKTIEAIRLLLNGKTYLTAHLAERMLENMTGFAKSRNGHAVESLSDRELEILELIGQGLGSAELAQRLKLSIKTIESHREHIKTKLGLRRATELVHYAFNWVHRGDRL